MKNITWEHHYDVMMYRSRILNQILQKEGPVKMREP